LRELEAGYADSLVVIGVHSAKFPAERDSRHLAAAVQRLEIEHPVINDADFRVWQAYAVRAWPTIMFIDPEGKVIAKHEGEFTLDMLAPLLDAMIAEFEDAGVLQRGPFAAVRLPELPAGPLSFPGKVLADPVAERLYIADTNHNRILITTLDGEGVQVIGSGDAGFADGSAAQARFNHPQGLTLDAGRLYVADTENHAIRQVELANGSVTTIAGTGQQARRYVSRGAALETDLTSPWDVVVVGGVLFIAMAGNHQLWMHRIGADEVQRFAGSGHEGLRDGPVPSAWLAQPSGITAMGGTLIFTDSETSSIRAADLPGFGEGSVRTFMGEDLFVFGDIDGGPDVARLQHPLGVAWHAQSATVFVADTYNNTIRRLNPETRQITTWLGDGEPDLLDATGSAARFFEPAGISVTPDALYVADTNNHAIRRADLPTGAVTTITITLP
jgi:DNA-binding beta-propeller fold protein YncE